MRRGEWGPQPKRQGRRTPSRPRLNTPRPVLPQKSQEAQKGAASGPGKHRQRFPFCVFFRFLRRSHSSTFAAPREALPGHASTNQDRSCRKNHKKHKKAGTAPWRCHTRVPILRLLSIFAAIPPRDLRGPARGAPRPTPQQTKTNLAAKITRNTKRPTQHHGGAPQGFPFCVFFRFLRRSHPVPFAAPCEALPGPRLNKPRPILPQKSQETQKGRHSIMAVPHKGSLFASSFDFCGDPTPYPSRLRARRSPAHASTNQDRSCRKNHKKHKKADTASWRCPTRVPFLRLLSIFAAIPLRDLRGPARGAPRPTPQHTKNGLAAKERLYRVTTPTTSPARLPSASGNTPSTGASPRASSVP